MTVKERVLISRLISRIDNNDVYAKKIGISYVIPEIKLEKKFSTAVQRKKDKQKING